MKYLLIMIMLIAQPAMSMEYPKAQNKESSLRNAEYSQDKIYILHTAVGFASHILMQKGEALEDWSSGDPDAWDVKKIKNMVVIKPKVVKGTSNLFLYSTKGRVYCFKISVTEHPYYGIRFKYPADEKRKAAILAEKNRIKTSLDESINPYAQGEKNYAYIGAGSSEIRPKRVFDNGSYTFMYFNEGQDLPAAFRFTPDGEKLTQKATKDNWLILPHVEKKWMLRLGNLVLCVKNEQFKSETRNHSSTSAPDVFLKVKPISEGDTNES